MELGKRGADRQEMHEEIRKESLKAWTLVQEGEKNPLKEELENNKKILKYLNKDEIEYFLNADGYIGDAIKRTNLVVERAKRALQK